MEHTARADSKIRFGVFEVDSCSGELRKAGTRIRLQDQPFKVLCALLEQPGEVVTREELKRRIWPEESFGDFDHAVNVAVAKLRNALGDSPGVPRFVETLPRRGYRFLAPVLPPGPVSAREHNLRTSKRRLHTVVMLGVMVILTAVALAAAGVWYVRSGRTTQIDSIAVLPFINSGGDANTEYLSDGLTESLIGSLSQLPNLAVRPRSSVFHYKSKDVDPQKAASELKVSALVTGRITQRGDSLLVSAELIDVRTNRSLWSDQYDRKLSDALSVQREIAEEISSRLREHLTGAQKTRVSNSGTSDPEAYQLYLKGRYYWDKRTPDALNKSKEFFQQATDKDPNYALAFLGLAEYYAVVGDYTPVSFSETNPKARTHAKKALAIDDTLAEAHAVLAACYDTDRDWTAGEREFQRALELDPNNSRTHVLYAFHLSTVGNQDLALTHNKRAVELDPLNLNALDSLGIAYVYVKQFDQAIEQLKETLEIDSTFPSAHLDLSRAYLLAGEYDLWLEEWEKGAQLSNDSDELALVEAAKREYPRAGYRGALKQVVALMEEQSKRTYVDPAWIAAHYALLGEKDQAFAWLEKAYAENSGPLLYIKSLPYFDSLRSDSRYGYLLKRMGLPQ